MDGEWDTDDRSGDQPGGRREPHPETANRVLSGIIVAFGTVVFAITASTGRADSALLFVAVPCLCAAALAYTPGRSAHGQVFRATTIALLVTSVAFHEGAICVILAAPLVYAVAHGTAALVRAARRRPGALGLLPIPLLLAGGVEGATGELRIRPDQTVEVVRVLPLTPAEVRAHLVAGPRAVPVRPTALRVLAVPVPHHVTGTGIAPGDRWTFFYPGSSHGSGGRIVTEVADAAADRLCFRMVEDSAITARWFDWRGACVQWRSVDGGSTEVRLTLSTRRGLDPSWYFGPLQDRLLHAGGQHLLDMLALP